MKTTKKQGWHKNKYYIDGERLDVKECQKCGHPTPPLKLFPYVIPTKDKVHKRMYCSGCWMKVTFDNTQRGSEI